MKSQINNKRSLLAYRKQLRNNLTPAEAKLWKYLQRSQLAGRKFRRQHSVGNYILDFYCPAEKLSVELDGPVHFTPAATDYDQERTAYLNSVGIKVIRFENKLVLEKVEAVLEQIRNNFRSATPSQIR